MIEFSSGEIRYYKFQNLEGQGLYHGIFTRHGGYSPPPWESLNFGASVGDEPQRVMMNRKVALDALDIPIESVYDLYQVHSTEVVITDRPLQVDENHLKADAIITKRPNVTLMMRFADCVPIFLFDPVHRVIAIIHAGWIGTVEKISQKTIRSMVDIFRTKPSDVIAAIGPSIGPDHYSIGDDVIARITKSFGNISDQFLTDTNGKCFFDMWKANQQLLVENDVTNIEVAEICTQCNLSNWYSHRGEHAKTGRFGAVLGLYA